MNPGEPLLVDLLADADDRLVRTVDALSPEELAEPSMLPGWTRAHVVAHLALNAEGLERVLIGQHLRQPATMYDSQEARDSDIERLASADPGELRDRALAGTHRFSAAVAALSDEDWLARFERTPGGQQIALADVPLMRLREVEIHHADLGSGYTAADWSPAFCEVLLDSATRRPSDQPFRVRAHDLDREWAVGGGDGPLVRGDAAALGWWLTGRGSGEDLACDGPLPRIGPW